MKNPTLVGSTYQYNQQWEVSPPLPPSRADPTPTLFGTPGINTSATHIDLLVVGQNLGLRIFHIDSQSNHFVMSYLRPTSYLFLPASTSFYQLHNSKSLETILDFRNIPLHLKKNKESVFRTNEFILLTIFLSPC